MAPADARDQHLRAILRQLPTAPGVYLMKGDGGRVLYVGKADSLRGRVRSYFGSKAGLDSRIVRMAAEVADIDYIVTDTISEAYLLEGNLIKEHRPRFNIRLRDDKTYPFVKITLGEDFPRIVRTRKLARDGSRYFGPYASASSVDETLKLLRKIFPFRTCNLDIPDGKRVLERPCLLYYINRCQGPWHRLM
jgi:excinuclease ABC subunit C